MVSITKGCAVAGLGGKPVYRTGDYNYYITEKIRSNDAKARQAPEKAHPLV